MATTVNSRSASSSDKSVYLSAQTTKGAINASPVFTPVRRSEGGPVQAIEFVQSTEIKSNRQGLEQVKDSVVNSAEITFELTQQTAGFLDSLIHSVQADNDILSATDIAATGTGFTIPSNALSVGDWFRVAGFADTTIDGTYKATVVAGSAVTTSVAPVATEVAGATIAMTSRKSSNAVSPTYYATQNRMVDGSAAGDISYDTFVDAVFNTGTLEVGEQGIITGNFVATIETLLTGNALISGQSDAASDVSSVLSAATDVSNIYVDGIDSACSVKSFGIDFNNNYQADKAASCDGEQYAPGDIELTGALVTRSTTDNTFDWRDKYRAGTEIALAALFDWPDGNWMVIEMPNLKITEHSMPDGQNVIATNEMTYGAQEDTVTSSTIQIFRNF